MSRGALTQLVSRGVADAGLTIADRVATSSFDRVYKKHAPFAIESIQQVFDGKIDYGERIVSTIRRTGDVIMGMHLEITLKRGTAPDGVSAADTLYPAEQLLRNVDLELGKVQVNKFPGEWLRVKDELFASSDQKNAARRMADFADGESAGTTKTFHVNLPFFFDKKPGRYIPLIAGQYHDVTVYIDIATSDKILGIDRSFTPDIKLYVDYAFLGTYERKMVAQTEHQFPITQLQWMREYLTVRDTPHLHKVQLNFNHPVRYLAWHFANASPYTYTATYPGESREAMSPMGEFSIMLNGTQRFTPRVSEYFNGMQPYTYAPAASQPCAGVYMYSFSRDLTEDMDHVDSTMNFSRVDSAVAQFTTKAANVAAFANVLDTRVQCPTDAQNLNEIVFYAENMNILVVKSGMYGVQFAN
jgi:hypothetical protein